MAIYAIWNNKGGVGKSYLTFQIACEYAKQYPAKKVLVVDLCPQANSSSMLLGGLEKGEQELAKIHSQVNKNTISGYISERLVSPYRSINSATKYVTQVSTINEYVPKNVYLVVGDEELEIQSSGILHASQAVHVPDSWRLVHLWVRDLVSDIQNAWDNDDNVVFIDCNPSFTIYTELALAASDRLIIPFSADGSSKRAVKSVLSLVYGVKRHSGDVSSHFYTESQKSKLALPQIYMYVGNRLTINAKASATAFKTVVEEIGDEIYNIWKTNANLFCIHLAGVGTPTNKSSFRKMFQYEVRDANTASVVSGALGIPISRLSSGKRDVLGKNVMVNQSQLDAQVPNIQNLVQCIE
ncbi:TPA: AAA family ATPase [Mannheimia haemolytica]|uniref:Septum formation inhibitor-activating ATPase n=1 Tax=Mannheimia haemolytica TaxID=75985 RepID=A0A378NDB2_MANHA|nr:AAA family ATPase [Mannheimia haemolytica]AGQ38855.1 ATPase [Mannheimia haemolytica D171]EEY11298.1 putative chromosome partitioning ATPase [Mannheimia haemolytica serotype A2 str. OVINE]EEY13288.1 putative chromosome partitioning ATPase [Mannheimia haemolytica serotype A2 str. BOVINE]KYL14973.1 ATPase [Mannheimia haemolytica]KYL21566.1 ATPase [Mannheimia haemolytica]